MVPLHNNILKHDFSLNKKDKKEKDHTPIRFTLSREIQNSKIKLLNRQLYNFIVKFYFQHEKVVES